MGICDKVSAVGGGRHWYEPCSLRLRNTLGRGVDLLFDGGPVKLPGSSPEEDLGTASSPPQVQRLLIPITLNSRPSRTAQRIVAENSPRVRVEVQIQDF